MTMNKQQSVKKASFFKHLKGVAKQFCLNTTLHGYRFIVLPQRTLLERSFWTVTVILSMIIVIVLLCVAWKNFEEQPTAILADSTHFLIWNYPFPAVTICSLNKISRSKARRLSEKLRKPDNISRDELFRLLKLLGKLIIINDEMIDERVKILQDILDMNNVSTGKILKDLAPQCDEMIGKCVWKNEEVKCEKIFQPVVSTYGYCCSFNYLALRKTLKPAERISACGYKSGLKIFLNTDTQDYFASELSSYGYTIIIHSAYTFPDFASQFLINEVGTNQFIGLEPTLTYATENIRALPVKTRKCHFLVDKQLEHLMFYTYDNCLFECRMNIIFSFCHCIPFYYQNISNNSQRICNLNDLRCLYEHKYLLYSADPDGDLEGMDRKKCGCLPDCEYVTYVADGSGGILTEEYIEHNVETFKEILTAKNKSVVSIFFNDLVAALNRRDVTFTWYTLLAYFGGLLGLFVGFSFVSTVEFIYFFIVQILTNITKKTHSKTKRKDKKVRY